MLDAQMVYLMRHEYGPKSLPPLIVTHTEVLPPGPPAGPPVEGASHYIRYVVQRMQVMSGGFHTIGQLEQEDDMVEARDYAVTHGTRALAHRTFEPLTLKNFEEFKDAMEGWQRIRDQLDSDAALQAYWRNLLT
jgi:hypothetical protein